MHECFDKAFGICKLEGQACQTKEEATSKCKHGTRREWWKTQEDKQIPKSTIIFFEVTLVSINMERGDPTWYIKFDAFQHVTSVGDLMCDLNKTLKIFKVRSTREHAHSVLSKCTIDVQTPIGEIKTIRKVLYVPSLKKSLLLVGLIINQGHVVVFIINGCHIVNKTSNCVVAKAMRDKENGLYRLQLFTPQVVVNVFKTNYIMA